MSEKKNKPTKANKQSGGKKPPVAAKDYSAWLIGISLLLTFIAYLPVLTADFVNWDDTDYVVKNAAIRSFSNFHDIVIKPVQGNYHPLTMLSLAFNYAMSGLKPGSYHFLNLLLHLINTVLVFKLASRLSAKNNLIAFTTALLFGIHPMHVESVAWIAERKDVLYALFFLLGLISYLKYLDDKTRSGYIFSLLWFLLSLASKPAAVIFPVALFTLDFFRGRKLSAKMIMEKIPFFIFAAILGYMTMHAQKTVGATDEVQSFTMGSRVLFFFYGYLVYFIKLIVPAELGAFHPFPPVNATLPMIYFLSPIFFLVVAILCFKSYKKYPVVTFGFGFYLVNLVLVLQFFVVGSAIIAERYTYVPYIGLFFLAGWFIDRKYRGKPSVAYGIVLFAGIIFTTISYAAARTWKSSLSLWEQVLKYNSTSSLAYENLARYYREDVKDYDKALENFNEGIKYERYKAGVYKSIGKTYFDKGNDAQNAQEKSRYMQLSIDNFNKGLLEDSISNRPDKKLTGEIYINRGSALATAGMLDAALNDFNIGLQFDPSNQNGYWCRSLYYVIKGNFAKAIEDNDAYLKLNPYDANIYSERGVNKRNLKQFPEALDDANKAIQLNNNEALFFLERAKTYNAMGNHVAAKEDAQQAKSMGLTVEPELLR